ncbi:MAG: sulfatase-like hydrolase/transferase [Candidatus Methanodesulfokora sp.]
MRPNIAIIIVDTLRADYATPLYREADRQGWIATTAIAPGTWTLPSTVSLLTGLYPTQHRVDETDSPAQDAKKVRIAMRVTNYGMLGWLKNEGYHIYVLTANPYLTPYFGFSLYDELFFFRAYNVTTEAYHALTREGSPLKAGLLLLRKGKVKTLTQAAAKYAIIKLAKHFPQIHSPSPPRDKGHRKIEKKLNEIELKEPYFLLINLMEAHSPYTKLESWVELSYLLPQILDELMCLGRAPKWAQEIWQKAYPRHAEYAAEIGARIAKKLADNAIVLITSDHGEMLQEGVFHGLPPNDELAIVPFVATASVKVEGIVSLTEIPSLIRSYLEGRTPTIGGRMAKTEYRESRKRHRCAKNRLIIRYYTPERVTMFVNEFR